MPAIPEFASPTPVALTYQPTPAPIAVLAGSFALLVIAAAAIAARAVLQAARPSRLRENDE
jgi:hypothetical protein